LSWQAGCITSLHAVIAYATGDYTMQQIADCFGVHYATVSRAVAQTMKNDAFRPD
jgi:transposase